ncbi:MAG TPA: NTP transferase domain-containing protein [Candidatus Thermoplasmatota archaeon]|nr:NTP transferase domain-containing protein [Candidatus Thermoplasmatota archaeon]
MRSGIVLAGGASSRMGSFKPLLPFRGRPLLAHALDALAPHCQELIVMAGARAAEVSRVGAGARVLADPAQGPHVALRLAARVARHPTLLVVPADAPFISDALPPLLAAGADAVARDGDGVNPLVALYDRERLLAALGDDARSLQQVAARLGARAVDAPARSLADADEPQDLRRLEG